MFTGIIEERGRVASVAQVAGVTRFEIQAGRALEDLGIGGSVAVNGVCLTATAIGADSLVVEAIPETLRRTNLGTLRPGSLVNLERSLALGARLEGHWVQGHVDTSARVVGRRAESQGSVRFEIELPASLAPYVVEKGSIAVDGVSLTVGEVTDTSFAVYLIPHTLGETTFGGLRAGSVVNLEADILAKYVQRMLARRDRPPPRRGDARPDRDAGGGLAAYLEDGG